MNTQSSQLLPERVRRILSVNSKWYLGCSVDAVWDVGAGHWGGIIHRPNTCEYVPFTYEPTSDDGTFMGGAPRLTLWLRDATEHMMEAIRRAATRCDQVWMDEAPYHEAEAQS